MRTFLTPLRKVPGNDAVVLEALDSNVCASSGSRMVIGIRNEAGEVYRAVEAFGPGEFMALAGALSALGLEDEPVDASGMQEGCDLIFSGAALACAAALCVGPNWCAPYQH